MQNYKCHPNFKWIELRDCKFLLQPNLLQIEQQTTKISHRRMGIWARASAKNFPGGSNPIKKTKISKKYRQIALFASSREGGNGKKTEK